eukprot:g2187.t1
MTFSLSAVKAEAASVASSSSSGSKSPYSCDFCGTGESPHDVEQCGPLLTFGHLKAHLYCSIFSPLVQVLDEEDPGRPSGIVATTVHSEIRRGRKLKCSICKKPGASIGCWICAKVNYHFPCALRAGLVEWHWYRHHCQRVIHCKEHLDPIVYILWNQPPSIRWYRGAVVDGPLEGRHSVLYSGDGEDSEEWVDLSAVQTKLCWNLLGAPSSKPPRPGYMAVENENDQSRSIGWCNSVPDDKILSLYHRWRELHERISFDQVSKSKVSLPSTSAVVAISHSQNLFFGPQIKTSNSGRRRKLTKRLRESSLLENVEDKDVDKNRVETKQTNSICNKKKSESKNSKFLHSICGTHELLTEILLFLPVYCTTQFESLSTEIYLILRKSSAGNALYQLLLFRHFKGLSPSTVKTSSSSLLPSFPSSSISLTETKNIIQNELRWKAKFVFYTQQKWRKSRNRRSTVYRKLNKIICKSQVRNCSKWAASTFDYTCIVGRHGYKIDQPSHFELFGNSVQMSKSLQLALKNKEKKIKEKIRFEICYTLDDAKQTNWHEQLQKGAVVFAVGVVNKRRADLYSLSERLWIGNEKSNGENGRSYGISIPLSLNYQFDSPRLLASAIMPSIREIIVGTNSEETIKKFTRILEHMIQVIIENSAGAGGSITILLQFEIRILQSGFCELWLRCPSLKCDEYIISLTDEDDLYFPIAQFMEGTEFLPACSFGKRGGCSVFHPGWPSSSRT